MSTLAPTLQTFFTRRLLGERQASPHTVAAYRDTFRLLPAFTTARLGKPPWQLLLIDLDVALRVTPERLALRIPIQVGVTAEVSYDGRGYVMPPEAAGMAGTLFLYRDHVHIVAGRYQAQHPRYIAKGTVSRQSEHRAAQLAAVSGKRGRRYLQREHLLETGEAALQFLTMLVHRAPRTWYRDVEVLHYLLHRKCQSLLSPVRTAEAGIHPARFAAHRRHPPYVTWQPAHRRARKRPTPVPVRL